MSRLTTLALGVATALFLAAPAAIAPASAADLYFSLGGPNPPPAPPVIVQPTMPHTGMVWREGHYMWRGSRYVWSKGEWVMPPYSTATWTPGHWALHDGHNVWIEGHWEG